MYKLSFAAEISPEMYYTYTCIEWTENFWIDFFTSMIEQA